MLPTIFFRRLKNLIINNEQLLQNFMEVDFSINIEENIGEFLLSIS